MGQVRRKMEAVISAKLNAMYRLQASLHYVSIINSNMCPSGGEEQAAVPQMIVKLLVRNPGVQITNADP